MTKEEINNLFTRHSYPEARKILIDEVHRMGINTTGNEAIFELRSLALGGSTEKVDKTVEQPELIKDPDPVEEENTEKANPENEEHEQTFPENEENEENKSDQDQEEEKSEPQKESKKIRRNRKSSIDKSEEDIRSEADRKMKEAQELLEIADKIKKMKEEEEKKRKEKEKNKKDQANSFILNEVVRRLKTLHKAFLVGPAGSGKTTLAINACKILFNIEGDEKDVVKSDKFAQISFSPDTISSDMLGFTDVNGVFHETDIIRVFRDGGVILFDEMDDADAGILVKMNTMLSNGVIPTPKGMVVQNPNTYIVSTANTYGTGGNSVYVGRNRLDGATLDRWKLATIYVDYDEKLESSIIDTLDDANAKAYIRKIVKSIRSFISANKLKQICSTRFVRDAVLMAANGYPVMSIVNTFVSDWDDNNKRQVINSIKTAMQQ